MRTVAAATKPPGRCCQREGHTLGTVRMCTKRIGSGQAQHGRPLTLSHVRPQVARGGITKPRNRELRSMQTEPRPRPAGSRGSWPPGAPTPPCSSHTPRARGSGLRARNTEAQLRGGFGQLLPVCPLCSVAGPLVSRSSGSPLLPPRALCIESVP